MSHTFGILQESFSKVFKSAVLYQLPSYSRSRNQVSALLTIVNDDQIDIHFEEPLDPLEGVDQSGGVARVAPPGL